MDYSLLKELIGHLEEFEDQTPSQTIEDFVIWLNNRLFSARHDEEFHRHDELLIAFKIMYLNKELKKKTKRVLSDSLLSSIDDYSFLLHLKMQASFRKMEIIGIHNLEAPTGIEIIKRLLKNKLIAEFPDQEDKRAKRIKITPKGVQELAKIQPEIEKIFDEFVAPLNLDEKIHASAILNLLMQPEQSMNE